MNFEELKIKGAYKITPKLIKDNRGSFFRSYCQNEFSEITDKQFVQMNQSINYSKGTLRGLHYQIPPYSEEKFIRCIKGEIFDVIVDLRKDSKTFLQWQGINLSEINKELIFIPQGIAHGFITLSDNTHVLYQHTAFYSPNFERGIRYDDDRLKIEWPVDIQCISEKDLKHPSLTKEFKGLVL